MFSSSLGRPILIFSLGYAAASLVFCFMTSAVSIPIENVVTGMPVRRDAEELVHRAARASCPSSPRARCRARRRPRGRSRRRFSALSSHVRCSHGERPGDGLLHLRVRRLGRLPALVPALVRGGLPVARHALGREREEAVLLLVRRAARDRPRVRELQDERAVGEGDRGRRRTGRELPRRGPPGRAEEAAAAADERMSPRREMGCVMRRLWWNPGMRVAARPFLVSSKKSPLRGGPRCIAREADDGRGRRLPSRTSSCGPTRRRAWTTR